MTTGRQTISYSWDRLKLKVYIKPDRHFFTYKYIGQRAKKEAEGAGVFFIYDSLLTVNSKFNTLLNIVLIGTVHDFRLQLFREKKNYLSKSI